MPSQTPEMGSMSPIRDVDDPHVKAKTKKSTKGWDGEVGDRALQNAYFTDGKLYSQNSLSPPRGSSYSTLIFKLDLLFSTLRTTETTANADGSATSHIVVRCTLSDIAQATGLRVEDAAFAMNECGMLQRHKRPNSDRVDKKNRDRAADPDDQEEYIVISREMVEAIAKERNVKRMCMDLAHVLL